MAPKSEPRALSIDTQCNHIADRYPSFCTIHSTPWGAVWQGKLRPLGQTYEIQMHYCSFDFSLAAIKAKAVHVEVISPRLQPRLGQAIPHIFANSVYPSRPRLCLHMPHEWDGSEIIADTIIPWTIEWLVAYEGWQATGRWFAGGHGTERST
jgi:hypothetical protein